MNDIYVITNKRINLYWFLLLNFNQAQLFFISESFGIGENYISIISIKSLL